MRTAKLLEAQDWLDAGLELLRVRGIGGVQVGPLCRRVGVTKGSFYHFFATRDAFHEQVIAHWRHFAMRGPQHLAEVARLGPLEDRVRAWLDFVREHDLGRYDLAMRTWAQEDRRARKAVQSIDRMRVTAAATLFDADGWPHGGALRRAKIMYYFIAGRYQVEGRAPTPTEGAEFARMLSRMPEGQAP